MSYKMLINFSILLLFRKYAFNTLNHSCFSAQAVKKIAPLKGG